MPETGVSIGEINRLLHERFGHDLHIEGDLVQTDTGGLTLTVRGDNVPASTFTGAAGDLDKLTTQAAEYVYGRSQPREYVAYLEGVNRDKDALIFLPAAFGHAKDDAERAALANVWGNAYADLFQPGPAVEKYRLTRSLAPTRSNLWWTAGINLVNAVWMSQGEEAGWREAHGFLQAAAAAPQRDRPELRKMSESGAGDLGCAAPAAEPLGRPRQPRRAKQHDRRPFHRRRLRPPARAGSVGALYGRQ